MNKKEFVFVAVLVVFLLIKFVPAQSPIGGADPTALNSEGERIKNASDKIQEIVQGGQNWTFLGEQWREIMLKNKFIGGADAAFKKVNFLFVFFLARDYSFSLTLLIVFCLWLLVLLIANKYLSTIDFLRKNSGLRTLAAIAISVIVSQMQILNYAAGAVFKTIFYRTEWYWSLVIFVIVLVFMIVFLRVNTVFAKWFKKKKEEKKKEELEHKVEVTQAYTQKEQEDTSTWD